MSTKLGYTATIARNYGAVLENCGYKGKQCHSLQCIERQKRNTNFSLFQRFDSDFFITPRDEMKDHLRFM